MAFNYVATATTTASEEASIVRLGTDTAALHEATISRRSLAKRGFLDGQGGIIIGTVVLVTVGALIGLLAALPAIIGVWKEHRANKKYKVAKEEQGQI